MFMFPIATPPAQMRTAPLDASFPATFDESYFVQCLAAPLAPDVLKMTEGVLIECYAEEISAPSQMIAEGGLIVCYTEADTPIPMTVTEGELIVCYAEEESPIPMTVAEGELIVCYAEEEEPIPMTVAEGELIVCFAEDEDGQGAAAEDQFVFAFTETGDRTVFIVNEDEAVGFFDTAGTTLSLREGTSGDDRLTGSGADEIFVDGAGNDKMSGRGGTDVFVFGAAAGDGERNRDVIHDFDANEDILLLESGAEIRNVFERNDNLVIRLEGDRDTIILRDTDMCVVQDILYSDDIF